MRITPTSIRKLVEQTVSDELRKMRNSKNVNYDVYVDYDNYTLTFYDSFGSETKKYISPPTYKNKMHPCAAPFRCVMGAYSSGKTISSIADILFCVSRMPKCKDGVRRARVLIIRQSYDQLRKSVAKDWAEWLGGLGRTPIRKIKQNPLEDYVVYRDQWGKCELEAIFMALEQVEDVARIKSIQTTFTFINEVGHLAEFNLISDLSARKGRYPALNQFSAEELDKSRKALLKRRGRAHLIGTPLEKKEPYYWDGILMDTNPPDVDHWLYRIAEVEKPDDFKLFKQPPAFLLDEHNNLIKDAEGKYILNPNAENLQNLQPNFYHDITMGQTDSYIKVYCCGQYGVLNGDTAVYLGYYNDDIHSVDEIEPREDVSVLLGIDTGLTPAAVLVQICEGQIHVFKEFVTKRCYFQEFLTDYILPYLKSKNLRLENIIYDPAGKAKDAINKSAPSIILSKLKLRAIPASTNKIESRINAVSQLLSRLHLGKSQFIIDRKECPTLRKGFLTHYHYKKSRVLGTDLFKTSPDKNFYSHIHDAMQYVALYLVSYKKGDDDDERRKIALLNKINAPRGL